MKQVIKYLLLSINILAVLALCTAYLSGYVSPEKWCMPSFFGLAYPVILAVNLFFLLFWLIFRPRFIFLSLIVIAMGLGFMFRYIQFKGKKIEKGDIEVLSFNVQHFAGKGLDKQQQTANEIIKFIEEQEADIICLQEVRLRQNSIFNLTETVEKLKFISHYQFASSSTTFGSVTMTRYPIVNMGEIRFEDSKNISIYTDMFINGDTIRVYNVHLHSYQIDPLRFTIIDSGIDEETGLKEVRELGSRFKLGFRLRAKQVEILKEHINNSPYSIIFCGDLNDTPASYSYQQLRKGMEDAFICSGRGIGHTYIGKLPYFRIDYIFHSKEFGSYNFKTYDFRYSDHLPVSCSLVKR